MGTSTYVTCAYRRSFANTQGRARIHRRRPGADQTAGHAFVFDETLVSYVCGPLNEEATVVDVRTRLRSGPLRTRRRRGPQPSPAFTTVGGL